MSARVDPLRSFELRAWARAVLLRECVFTNFGDAFEPLWADATRDGLVAQYGSEVLMQLIEHAYHQVGMRIPEEPA